MGDHTAEGWLVSPHLWVNMLEKAILMTTKAQMGQQLCVHWSVRTYGSA